MSNVEKINKLDNEHFIHPWEEMNSLGGNERAQIEDSHGIYVKDVTGCEYIDGPGGMWCVQIGYGRTDMAEAISEQVSKLAYFSPFNNTNSNSTKLANELAKHTPGDLNHIFFTTGGSTAVDTALRFVQFRNNVLGLSEKKIVISLQNSYHGSTFLASSVSSRGSDKLWLDTADHVVHFLPAVNHSKRFTNLSKGDFLEKIVDDLENSILQLGPERVAAYIAEPIQASGGVIIPPEGYHKRCLEICKKYNVVYISDEVVTGFGRLGHWFASESVFGIAPDIITCAKGITSGYLPMGAVAISNKLVGEITENCESNTIFSNGYTYSGHPVCAVAALKNIEIIKREKILEHARKMSPIFLERLHAMGEFLPVTETRGIGLVGCIECGGDGKIEDGSNIASKIDEVCQENGLLVRPIKNMCVLSPPLIIDEGEINRMFDILELGIKSVLT